MSHPSNRAERRRQRERVIARRRFVHTYIWNANAMERLFNPLSHSYFPEQPIWGYYAKWNMNCGSTMCHSGKYFTEKRRRREALKRSARMWQKDDI